MLERFNLFNLTSLIPPLIPITMVILALISPPPLSWVFIILLIFASGYALQLFINRISGSRDNNILLVPTMSVVMSSITYLLVNYLPFPISKASVLWSLGLITSALLLFSYLPRKQKEMGSKISQNRSQFVTGASKTTSRIRNPVLLSLIIVFIIVFLVVSPIAAVSLLVWPSWLLTLTGYLSPYLPVLMITALGIPLTVIFWIYIFDPNLSSYSSLSKCIIDGDGEIRDSNKHVLHMLPYLIPSVTLASVLTILPNIIGFLPPGFDTPFHILYLKGIYSQHFTFPFPIPGRMRGSRPAAYLFMGFIMHALGVNEILTYQIFVVTTYVLATIAVFLLISNFSNLRVAAFTSVLFSISIPTLELTCGLVGNLYGMFLFLMSLVFLLAPNRNKSHIVKFVMVTVLLFLAHELMPMLFFWVIATIVVLEVFYSLLYQKLRGRIVPILKFLFFCSMPLLITLPYLLEYLRIYVLRFPSQFVGEPGITSSIPSNFLYSATHFVWSPKGWFGPLLLFACLVGFYVCTRARVHEKEQAISVLIGVLFGVPLVFWLLTGLSISLFAIDDPLRAIILLPLSVSYVASTFTLKNRTKTAPRKRTIRYSIIDHCFNLDLKKSIAIAFAFVILFSSMQFSLGIHPNIFDKPWAPAATPITGLSYEGYKTMLWMRGLGLNGTVVVDGTFGTWPSVITNMTTVIFWSYNEAQIWRPHPFWEKRIALDTNGFFGPLFLLDFASKHNLTVPIYIMDSYGLLGNAFPKTSQSILDRMLDKIYESGGIGKEKVYLYRLDGVPKWLLYNITVDCMRAPQGTVVGALRFDGENDYVGLGDVLDFGVDDFTVELWIKTNSANRVLVGKVGSFAHPGWCVSINFYGKLSSCIHGVGGADYGAGMPSDGTVVNDGVWHHVAVVFDRDGNMTRYVDGVVVGSQVDISGESGSVDNAKEFQIAARNHTEPSYFAGVIDEVRVYNRVLNAAEINEHYDGTYPNETGLVLYLPFDEDTQDRSELGNHGTIYGATFTSDSPLWERYMKQVSLTLESNYDAEKNIYNFTVNITNGEFYTIYDIPIQLSLVKISPQPSELEHSKDGFRFSGDPSMMYTLTFESEAPYLNYVWREDIFQVGWGSEGAGNFSSLDGEAILRLKVKEREAFEQIYHTLEPEIFEEEKAYFIFISHKSNSTNAAPYSYTIAVRLWSQEGEELLYQELPQYKDCKIYIVTISKDVAQKAAKIGLLLYGRYDGEYEWRIDSITIAY